MRGRLRVALLCTAGAAAVACGGGSVDTYATYGEVARAVALPPYVPGTAHDFRVVAEEEGARWMSFQVPAGDAQRMVDGMRVLTYSRARTGRFTPPGGRASGWPSLLAASPAVRESTSASTPPRPSNAWASTGSPPPLTCTPAALCRGDPDRRLQLRRLILLLDAGGRSCTLLPHPACRNV